MRIGSISSPPARREHAHRWELCGPRIRATGGPLPAGFTPLPPSTPRRLYHAAAHLDGDGVDVLLTGEARDWDRVHASPASDAAPWIVYAETPVLLASN
jgi:hypothetical protein